MAHQLNDKMKTFSNKILLLNYLRHNFGINREALEEIQRSCNKLTKLMNECRKKGQVQKKHYEFVLHEIFCVQNMGQSGLTNYASFYQVL